MRLRPPTRATAVLRGLRVGQWSGGRCALSLNWFKDALPGLPRTMARTGQRAGSYEREIVDVVEAALLAGREGEEFDGVVVDVEDDRERARRLEREGGDPTRATRRGQVVLTEPAVRAPVEGEALPLGEPVRAILREASVAGRRVRFGVA